MLSRYTGARYRAGAHPDLVAFVEADELHTLDYAGALDFYEAVLPHATDGDLAYLGCVDRFFLFTSILGRLDGLHLWLYDRFREVELAPDGYLDLWAREHYKAVDVNEPVPTPVGFKRHGDLVPGDWVYGSNGDPVRVKARTRVFTDADCYRVTFDDGYSVVVSGQHLWTVEQRSSRRVPGEKDKRLYRETVTLETREMARHTHGADDRFAVRVAPAVMNIEHFLPIEPYLLGAWLGDGTSANGTITCSYDDGEIIDRIRGLGCEVRERKSANENSGLYVIDPGTRKGEGFTSVLRAVGVLKNKHIPRDYLVASVAQRLELLRGLMDTDGHCNTRGTAIFVNKSERLAQDVMALAASLGLKPRWNSFEYDHGTVYHVAFQAYSDMPPFHLQRKVSRCKAGEPVRRRFVVSVERTETIPVSCIEVEAADGLYLIGERYVTTHNSTAITYCGAIQEIINDPEVTIGIFSHTRDIAKKFVAQVKREFEANAELRRLYPDVCWLKPKTEAPVWSGEAFTVRRRRNPKEATMEAWGLVDGQPTGKHFALLVYDDVVTLASVSTPEQVRKTTEAWELSDNLGAGKRRKWMIGTRYSFGDSYGDIMQRGVITPRVYPATHNGKPEGKPVFLSQEAWDEKKKTQLSTLAAQMLQNPLSGKERTFQPKWLRGWEVRPATMNVYILCDPSRGRTSTSDRTAMAVIGIDRASNKYLLDGFCHRMTLSERWDHLKHLHKKWKDLPGIGILKVGYERFGQQSDDEYFRERMRDENYHFAIQELAWPREGGASKQHRVERLQPDFEYDAFYVPALVHRNGMGACKWSVDLESGNLTYTPLSGDTALVKRVKARGQGYLAVSPIMRKNEKGEVYDLTSELISEMLFFPFAQHDDLVDAVSRIYDMDPMPASVHEEMPELPAVIDA